MRPFRYVLLELLALTTRLKSHVDLGRGAALSTEAGVVAYGKMATGNLSGIAAFSKHRQPYLLRQQLETQLSTKTFNFAHIL